MYEIRVTTKADRYGKVNMVIARSPKGLEYETLISAMEEVNNNKFVYDYQNNETIKTDQITAIYLVEQDPGEKK